MYVIIEEKIITFYKQENKDMKIELMKSLT